MRKFGFLCIIYAIAPVYGLGGIIYTNALPNIFLNDPAGSLRSNIALGESDPTAAFDGDSFTLSSSALIDSITTWSIASTYGEALGVEFSEIDLYFRAVGSPWQLVASGTPDTLFDVSGNAFGVGDSNPDITHTQVSYAGAVTPQNSYEGDGTPGVYYPLWENSFTNLNLTVQANTTYQFAVNGIGANPDSSTLYGYWFNSFSNGLLSGSKQDGADGTYLRCDYTFPGSYAASNGPCFVADPLVDGTWDKGADMNVRIDGVNLPEPATYSMLGVSLCGFLVLLRRRTK